MLKLLMTLPPMVLGVALAAGARAEIPLDARAGSPVSGVQSNLDKMANGGLQTITVKAPSAVIAASDAIIGARRETISRPPQPGDWVIMLTGFGAVGLVARHRRAHRTA